MDKPLGLQEVEAPWILKETTREGGRVVSPTNRSPVTPEDTPCAHFCQVHP